MKPAARPDQQRQRKLVGADQQQQELVSNLTHMALLLQKAMAMSIEEKEAEIKNISVGLMHVENFLNARGLLADFIKYIGQIAMEKKSRANAQQ